jgi:hypothetical protein
MVVVEQFANSPTCTLGNFACAPGGADTDVLAGDGSAFADVASGVEWVKCDKIACTLSNTLGRCSGSLGGSFADVPGSSTDVATGASLMRLTLGGRLRGIGMGRRGLSLAVLTAGVQAADGECEKGDEWSWECGSHGLDLPLVRLGGPAEDSLSRRRSWQNPKCWSYKPKRR